MMNRFLIAGLMLCVAAITVSCESKPGASGAGAKSVDASPITGTVSGLSSGHGNVYTSIAPTQYAPLGLVAGATVRVRIGDHDLALPVAAGYDAVPPGQPLAVLHREGLTFAIRDGNFARQYNVTQGMPFSLTIENRTK